ncbi:hypothetical protein AYJ58_15700 [Shewanella sp. Pdp11]|nr:hypothetical protein AYJ58_15700 [Shewanella sp. Pdp11]
MEALQHAQTSTRLANKLQLIQMANRELATKPSTKLPQLYLVYSPLTRPQQKSIDTRIDFSQIKGDSKWQQPKA